MKYRSRMVDALCTELKMQASYLSSPLKTVYFGGGTPSLLSRNEIIQIWNAISDQFDVSQVQEVTFECNPDDLTENYLHELSDTPIDRLSIGIQSFLDKDLTYMNRAHNAQEAISCIKNAKKFGFRKLTVDLIYGTPTMNETEWLQNIQQVLDLEIPHISCYSLTVEPRTALSHFVSSGKLPAPNDDQAAAQFDILVDALSQASFRHYEISNFAKAGHESIHNSSYWEGTPYLGIGPSAHSFDGKNRQWNVANNAKYMAAIESGKVPFEKEILNEWDQYNERVMVGLRRDIGVDLNALQSQFAQAAAHFSKSMESWIVQGYAQQNDGSIRLLPNGRFLADGIAASCFLDEEEWLAING